MNGTTATAPAAPKTRKPRKAKAAKAKAAPKAKAKSNKAERAPKFPYGMRVAQVRVLRCLAKAVNGLNRAKIIEKADFDPTWFGEYVGSNKGKAAWVKAEKRIGFPGLLLSGLVKETEIDLDGFKERFFQITPKGTKALAECGKK